ncbi:hypothetical protein DFH08DRAFT_929221 [Mycena albidolilacea]|uniref:Uncharacterized protein n=1 Tax=Mycena albidolilacea TaxID=1033008 RepID=A0AAD7AQR3_9AGAR|nr:hypothetical protein DFH08DRAFT_929221 [Mycena albidolilacea]
MYPSWSDLPPELTREIAGHNAHDRATLRAMSLVSKATRSLVIPHIFSTIQFDCVEDFGWWLDILRRTPVLTTVVKKVKFHAARSDWRRRRDRRGLKCAVTTLRSHTAPPVIPPMSRVRAVEWAGVNLIYTDIVAMAVAHTALFPNVEKLHLCSLEFSFAGLANLLGACRRLKSLSLHVARDSNLTLDFGGTQPRQAPFDLTALEEVVLTHYYPGRNDILLRLLQHSSPARLQTLSFGDFHHDKFDAFHITETLSRFSSPSLVNLVVDPIFPYEVQVLATFTRLPAFVALESLTLWLRPGGNALTTDSIITGISAPNLTRLVFRIVGLDEAEREEFDDILRVLLPWQHASKSESMKTILTRKFPSCSRIEFHFCGVPARGMHFRRGIERRLRDWLEFEIGAGITVEWLDEACNPVRYNDNEMTGKWLRCEEEEEKFESEAEASDCDCGSDGSPATRGWTEAHEPDSNDSSVPTLQPTSLGNFDIGKSWIFGREETISEAFTLSCRAERLPLRPSSFFQYSSVGNSVTCNLEISSSPDRIILIKWARGTLHGTTRYRHLHSKADDWASRSGRPGPRRSSMVLTPHTHMWAVVERLTAAHDGCGRDNTVI